MTRKFKRPDNPEKYSRGKSGEQSPLKRGDIYWADFPSFGGAARQGRRPVLVIQNNMGNRFAPTVIVSPITSRTSKKQYPTNVVLPDGVLNRTSELRVGQIVTIDKFRLGSRIARLPESVVSQVDEAIRVSLGLPRNPGGN